MNIISYPKRLGVVRLWQDSLSKLLLYNVRHWDMENSLERDQFVGDT